MFSEERFDEHQSLALITSMINKAKDDYKETGVGALLWGGLVAFCSLMTFGNFYWNIPALNYIWFLTLFALIPQIIISVRAAKKKKYQTHQDEAMGAIWISFGVALTLLSVYDAKYNLTNATAMFLVMYGIPTFSTGYIYKFKPFLTGGIVFWICAVICFYIQFPYAMLCTAAAALIAWVIPGLILKKRYMKAKQHNV